MAITLHDPDPLLPPRLPAVAVVPRTRTASFRAVGAIGALLVTPPAVFGLLQAVDPESDLGLRDAFERGLMAASVLFMLVLHVWALVLLLRESRAQR
ncbi:hypothetical protein [Variovorax sp. KK3]|uniref:hypothetical protein n=1 Tax=Variovorax sp. KK3 TaxID=1855728 RepID=UPI00097BE946|nr:hypothetical protein [Variovorax sp. KK3]